MVRECARCDGTTKSTGARCKRRTCMTGQYCWQHLMSEKGLRVKPSLIPGAGLGLFATKDIKRKRGPDRRLDVKIIQYTGELISDDELIWRYGQRTGPYTLTVGNQTIDSRSTQSSVARYANGCDRTGRLIRCNARINRTGWLCATTTIRAGQEIMVPYGWEYWEGLSPL